MGRKSHNSGGGDAFGVSIEIINSNSVSFAPVTVLPQGIPKNLVKKPIILGHID